MSYLIQLKKGQEEFFGSRNSKGEWTAPFQTPEGSTSFKTKNGAWRAIRRINSGLASASGYVCWHDLLQREGYEVDVVNV